MKKLNFQIEVGRVLEILSNDIYDSPYALLRENIQNAYDAILMRLSEEGEDSFEPKIQVTIKDRVVSIADNGIGMTEEVLANNFWKAGSSGKNNEIARKAGVVGTFGIGAMANFGVANQIRVISRKAGVDETLETCAERENLSVTEECVSFIVLEQMREEPGTTVEATIDSDVAINQSGAIQYLRPYIQHVRIPILINGQLVSQKDYHGLLEVSRDSLITSKGIEVNTGNLSCGLNYTLAKNGSINLKASNIKYGGSKLVGDIVLRQGKGSIYGLRNYFGLAPLPAPNNFNFGGIVNLNNLHPTAGREALSRDSIDIVTKILHVLEDCIANDIYKFDAVDNNSLFLNYIVSKSRYELAEKITIEVKPDLGLVALGKIGSKLDGKEVYYYGGRDPSLISTFANENSYLLHLSQSNPRRNIQIQVLRQKKVKEVPDHPTVNKVINRSELSLAEAALIVRMSSILSEDYLLPDNMIFFAEISHKVPSMVKKEEATIKVFLSRNSPAIQQVITAYDTAYEVFGGFVKDFIRNYLYQKFSNHIPSSTRQGAETLHKILQKNRELFKYDSEDLGELDSVLGEYVAGRLELSEVIKKSSAIRKTHTQSVGVRQVGSAEQEIPSLTGNVILQREASTNSLMASPPIDRQDTATNMKILKTSQKYSHLNNFSLFLSLADSVYRRQLDFFFEPHTTKVIWGMHRIVYIFTHASSNLSLYYDIELKKRLLNESTGGKPIPTTTLLTDSRIFIPVIDELVDHFDVHEGRKEFYVRHDMITDFSSNE